MTSRFTHVPKAPEDAILGVTLAFKADPNPDKINVGVGAYRTDEGKPLVLEAVRRAEERMLGKTMEYLPVIGHRPFIDKAVHLAYGDDCEQVNAGCYAAIQALSGTGACRMAADFLSRFLPVSDAFNNKPLVLMPTPTWANHPAIFKDGGCDIGNYAYYDAESKSVNFDGMMASLSEAPSGAVVLLHATAHNPTGCDLNMEQWAELSELMLKKNLLPLFDNAYQGFTSGDVDADAASVRKFARDGHQVVLAQSFSKNFGLYAHRVGCMSVLTETPKEGLAINSQLKIIARPSYSNAPIYGVRIVDEILGSPELEPLWRSELRGMAARIIRARRDLKHGLEEAGSQLCWDHVVDQKGMFCYSGLTPEQVRKLREEHSVYMTANGRISMAGVTQSNYVRLAEAIHKATQAS